VPVVANTRDSDDVPFSLVLSAPGDGLLDRSFGHGLVLDDDPTPTLTVGNAQAGEKAGTLRFPVRLPTTVTATITDNG
jgi:hypothetical protein